MLPFSSCKIYPSDNTELGKGVEAVGAALKMFAGCVSLVSIDIPVTVCFAYKETK